MAYETRLEDSDERFPRLTKRELERIERFGQGSRHQDGETLLRSGTTETELTLILSGHLAVTERDGLGRRTPLVVQGPGQFLGELRALSDGATSLVDARAVGDVEVLSIPPAGLRALMVAEAELGERIMRALLLRHIALERSGNVGPVLVGARDGSDVMRLHEFLARNGQPHEMLDPAQDAYAAALLARLGTKCLGLPLVICPDGSILENPRESELAALLGLLPSGTPRSSYDVAVVGAGPAGLATAVNAASEGLSVVVLDSHAYGGQAGASSRIENYFGFPAGISGLALTGRAHAQAQKFGAEMRIPVRVTGLDCARTDGAFGVLLEGGVRLRARAVVVATGARYRRPAVLRLSEFEGRGVSYGASPFEAQRCLGEEVIVIGGGNSAAQAAVFLAGYASRVRMMVRASGLSDTMSRYLVDRIAATANIELSTETQLLSLEGSPGSGLTSIRYVTKGTERDGVTRNVFLFVGAEPATDWLVGSGVEVDQHGFVSSGAGASPLASNVPGVFAVGDVRSGSVKRVGSAIGEGAQVVAAIHQLFRSPGFAQVRP